MASVVYYLTYLICQPNPVFQVAYYLLSMGGFVVFVLYGFVHLPNPYLASYHIITGTAVYLFAFCTYFIACMNEAGVVTKASLSHLKTLIAAPNRNNKACR